MQKPVGKATRKDLDLHSRGWYGQIWEGKQGVSEEAGSYVDSALSQSRLWQGPNESMLQYRVRSPWKTLRTRSQARIQGHKGGLG